MMDDALVKRVEELYKALEMARDTLEDIRLVVRHKAVREAISETLGEIKEVLGR